MCEALKNVSDASWHFDVREVDSPLSMCVSKS